MRLWIDPHAGGRVHNNEFLRLRVAADSIYGLLHRECFQLFPDELFTDLFCDVVRRSVPPMIVAVVMVLQRIEGRSDREAVDRFTYDAGYKRDRVTLRAYRIRDDRYTRFSITYSWGATEVFAVRRTRVNDVGLRPGTLVLSWCFAQEPARSGCTPP